MGVLLEALLNRMRVSHPCQAGDMAIDAAAHGEEPHVIQAFAVRIDKCLWCFDKQLQDKGIFPKFENHEAAGSVAIEVFARKNMKAFIVALFALYFAQQLFNKGAKFSTSD